MVFQLLGLQGEVYVNWGEGSIAQWGTGTLPARLPPGPSVKFKVTQGWSPAVHQRSQPGVVLFPVLAALVPSPPVSSLYSGRQGFANIFQPA